MCCECFKLDVLATLRAARWAQSICLSRAGMSQTTKEYLRKGFLTHHHAAFWGNKAVVFLAILKRSSKHRPKPETQDIWMKKAEAAPQGFLRELLAAGPFHPRSCFSYLNDFGRQFGWEAPPQKSTTTTTTSPINNLPKQNKDNQNKT